MARNAATVVLAVAFLALTSTSHVHADIGCQEALTKMLSCEFFLLGFGTVPVSCCQAAQNLNALANTKPGRTSICQCFQQAALALKVNAHRAKQIPQLCNINIPNGLIDPNVKCDNYPVFDGGYNF